MPFPMEIITLLGSGLLTGIMTLWSQSLKAKKQQADIQLALLAKEKEMVDAARQFGAKNPGFSFTRRTLAIMSVFAVIVLPKLAALWGLPPVTVGYTEFDPGFWFFTEGKDVIKWVTATGFVLTPLDTHFCAAVAGMYFGSSSVKNA